MRKPLFTDKGTDILVQQLFVIFRHLQFLKPPNAASTLWHFWSLPDVKPHISTTSKTWNKSQTKLVAIFTLRKKILARNASKRCGWSGDDWWVFLRRCFISPNNKKDLPWCGKKGYVNQQLWGASPRDPRVSRENWAYLIDWIRSNDRRGNLKCKNFCLKDC